MKGRVKLEIPEKTRRPAAGVARPGIEPSSSWWEASRLTAVPPGEIDCSAMSVNVLRPHCTLLLCPSQAAAHHKLPALGTATLRAASQPPTPLCAGLPPVASPPANPSYHNSNNNDRLDPHGNKLPFTPQEALKLYGNRLTPYERVEIEEYPDVWYLGLDACKIHGDPQNGENKKRFHHQALIEVRILDDLRKKDKDGSHNIIHMLEYFYFRNHLCISFELMR
ncbi:hypothetical protein PR048_024089 [Dryococelus australis]|uniref:dual-specificity kinase n=1 Tax=Dryococelus australis TaxID=614101 RepID=A0ABQ9GVW1_9NEOP|nr:hypothetical protein PR048_024089 [Dryococelus australis]